ncbi:MAG: hypothetical protein ACOY4B_15545 [Pseudomonadota bacterium]|uniref:hypothetical protein n=1 Tax=Sphingomonas sp. TaxID=28214 RepID=UPI0030FCF2C2
MNDQTTAPPQGPYDAPTPSALAMHWMRLCQMPLMLGTAWWNAALQAMLPPREPSHISADPHSQLIVPDPIEQDGERALVA